MRTGISKGVYLLPLGALVALAGFFAGPASASSLVPFSATFSEDGPAVPCPFPTLCITIHGTGQASHLGQTVETSSATLNLLSLQTTGCSAEARTAAFVGANGDELDVLFIDGQTCMTSPTSGESQYVFAITGGTGRFVGARGSGTARAGFTLATSSSPGSSFTTLSGAISSPGSLP